MRKLIVIAIVGLIAWYGNNKYQPTSAQPPRSIVQKEPARHTTFNCDGRTYCSQMTSCAEATYFLKNCPDTKMDGDNDGVPCEQQWC